jgi:hypothetical protein
MKKSSKIKLNPALRTFLKPAFGKPRRVLTNADWQDFKTWYGPRCQKIHRNRRNGIKRDIGKYPEEFSLDEFLDYLKPNSSASKYLKELWQQLDAEEQELVKNLNEGSFIFPATFKTKRQYLVACAFRLERFFNRKFHPVKAKSLMIQREDAKFGKLVEAALFDE